MPKVNWGSKFTRRKPKPHGKTRAIPHIGFPTTPLHQAPTKRYRVIVPTTVSALEGAKKERQTLVHQIYRKYPWAEPLPRSLEILEEELDPWIIFHAVVEDNVHQPKPLILHA